MVVRKKFVIAMILAFSIFGIVPVAALEPDKAQSTYDGTSYYVSSSLGSDANNGQSSSSPWKTLEKVSSQVFKPGDQILLLGGDVWKNESLTLSGSGTEQAPIILSSYGTGKPKIIYPGSAILMKNVSGWTIRGLELHNTYDVAMTGGGEITPTVSVTFTNGGVYHDLIFEDNHIYGDSHDRNIRGITLMSIYPGRTDEVAHNIVIRNNVIHDVGWDAIMVYGWDTIENSNLTTSDLYRDVKILNNTLYNTGNSGIILGTTNHADIKWNLIYDNGIYTGTGNTLGCAGIVSIVTSYVDIMFNEVYRVSDSASGNDGEGIDVDWLSEHNRVMYNYCHDNIGPALSTMSNTHTTMRFNRVSGTKGLTHVGNGQITLTDFRPPAAALTGVNFMDVSDNLIIVDQPNTTGISTRYFNDGSWLNNYISNNNIVLLPGVGIRAVDIGTRTALSGCNQNTIYSENGMGFVASFHGQTYWSLTNWQNDIGYDLNSVTALVDGTAPTAVQNPAAVFDGNAFAASLSWDASSDSGSGVWHYNIFRSDTPDFTPAYTNMVGESEGTAFIDTQELEGNTTYCYIINAEDENGNWSAPCTAVSLTTGTAPAPAPRTYQASGDFSVIHQGSVWRYQSFDGTDYVDLSQFDNSWNAWHPSGGNLFVAAYSQMPDTDKDSVRTFVAPFDGTLTIDSATIAMAGSASGADGVLTKVLQNGIQVWPAAGWKTITSESPALFPATQLVVQKGDSIRFVVNRNDNITGDIVIWDPAISYDNMILPPDVPVLPPPVNYGLPEPLTIELAAHNFDDSTAGDFRNLSGSWSVVSDGAGGYQYSQSSFDQAASLLGDASWKEYSVCADMEAATLQQGGRVGLYAMYQDNSNYYRVHIDETNGLQLYKMVGGTESLLGTAPCPFLEGQTYPIGFSAYRDGTTGGQKLSVEVGGQNLLSVIDDEDIIAFGKAGLYSENAAVVFDNVYVETLANAFVEALDVILYDTFQNGITSLWNREAGTWEIDNSTEKALMQSQIGDSLCTTSSSGWDDFIVQAQIEMLAAGADGGSAGFMVRYQDDSNYMCVSLCSDGFVKLTEVAQGITTVVERIDCGFALGQETRLKVVTQDADVAVYVNGKKVLSAITTIAAAENFALATQNASARFDDVTIQAMPNAGNAYFDDDFESGNMDSWQVSDGNWSVVKAATNACRQTGYGAGLVSSGSGFTNFDLRYRMEIESTGAGDAYGNICFKYTDINNMYYVHFNTYYGIALKKAVGGLYSELDVKPYYPIEVGAEYRVRILVNESDIVVYINGEKVLSAKDNAIDSGGIALWTINANVMYDDIIVQE